MTTDSRKVQLEVGVDATDAKTGFQQVKDSAKDMAQSVKKSGDDAAKGLDGIGDGLSKSTEKFTRDEGRLRAAIQRSTLELQNLGKTASQKFEAKVDFLGFDQGKFAPYIAEMKAAEMQAKAAANSLNTAAVPALQKVGVSAAQTAAALRGVPAQFTDIVTSLQGGQAPLTVLLQQGGQLKDMFGGVGPAAKALGGYIAGLVTPLTLAAGAVGGLAVAMYQGSKESEAYAKALILTGNSIGKTTDQLKDTATAISKITGTQGDAAEALAAMAQSGKIASASFQDVGAAVVSMSRVMGTSIDDAVGQFAKLADAPAKTSAELNEKLHYLNLATYERIRALEEQGQKEEATALAQKTLADATTTRMAAVEAQAGVLARAFRLLTHDVKETWDAVAGLGRPETTGEKLAGLQKQLADRQARGSLNSLTGTAFDKGNARLQTDIAALSRQALREQDNAYAEGEKARAASAQIDASDRLKKLTNEIQTNADKRKKAIADLNRDYQTLGKATSGPEYDKLVSNINEKFKDPKGAAPKAYQDDAATRMLESLRQQEASLKEQLSTDEKLTASEKERAKFAQLIADLKGKKQLTVEQQSLLANQDLIKAAYDTNVALEQQIVLKEKAAKLAEVQLGFEKQLQGITLSYESANESRSEQYDRMLSTVGLGTRARQEVEAQKSIRKEYDRYILQVNRDAAQASADAAKNGLPFDAFASDDYKKKIVELDAARESEIQKQKDAFAEDKKNRENWVNGAREAFANYSDYASNAAAHTEEVFGNALKGIEDQLTNLFTGKKFDAKKL
ncbi:phage tail length tape measure family protein, partial [Variovorax sp. dw_308]|uniref:phage tail length tape measure family protein n=1 Tax=Variovorax sp. dw_308 TaxID=2721546 RepID=UPI001C48FBBD